MKKTVRLGSQEPTFSVVGDYHHSFGEQAICMFERWGVRFYPCQKREMELFLARDRHNRYACRTICISKPRQNGKSFDVRFYAIECAACEGKHVLFTAHRGKTVRKMFKFIRTFILKTPDLAEKLLPGADGIYKAAGSEGIYFANGGLIEFATRTDGGGRGETYDVIIFDEAQELTDEQYDAVVPTTIASDTADPQKIYLGTPPGPKCQGAVFKGMHDKAHAGASRGVWWLEWAVDAVPDMSDRLAVLELAYLTNPAMGYRIREDVMLDAIDSATSPVGFAREFLGWWSSTSSSVLKPIAKDDWRMCATGDAPESGDVVYAVKFSPDGLSGALAACLVPEDGKPHVEVIEERSLSRGVGWFADFMVDVSGFAGAIVIDGKANAQTLNDKIVDAEVDEELIVRPSTSDVITANSAFVDATRNRAVTHSNQPGLNDSATLCGRRRIGSGGGFGFQSNTSANAEPVEACALAYWCAMSIRRNPQTELRIG